MAEFKDRLRELRQAHDMSQLELANRLGVHPMTISGYERGIRRPDFEVLDDLAEALDASFDYLLGNDDSNTGYPGRYHDRLDTSKIDTSLADVYVAGCGTPTPVVIEKVRKIAKKDRDAHLASYGTALARIITAYAEASPDTQAAVRAILHVEDDNANR